MSDKNIENMTDDELMAMEIPPETSDEEEDNPFSEPSGSGLLEDTIDVMEPEVEEKEEVVTEPVDEPVSDDDSSVVDGDDDTTDTTDNEEEPVVSAVSDDPHKEEETEAEIKPESKDTAKDKEEPEKKDSEKKPDEKVDYEALYKQITAPFKANGKMVQMTTPDEIIRLMQQGANYTKKMQGLGPNLRVVRMLEENNLLDESKLNYLIDLNNKNPDAINKLVKEAGLDPMDIDTESDSNYTPNNYSVPEQQIKFETALDEVTTTTAGKEMVVKIHQEWDKESKDAIYKDPNLLRLIVEQKQTGIYDQISAEVERQRMLGQLNDMPSLKAYYQVGQAMQNQGLLKPNGPAPVQRQAPNGQPVNAPQAQTNQSQAVETRSTARRKPIENSDKVKAAASFKPAKPVSSKADFNPLSMSDEDFMKNADLANKL